MRILQIALLIALLSWGWAWRQTRTLPEQSQILPELLVERQQRFSQWPATSCTGLSSATTTSTADDYRRITLENTPTWCHWSWHSEDIRFHSGAIANNHLVTDDDALRAAL